MVLIHLDFADKRQKIYQPGGFVDKLMEKEKLLVVLLFGLGEIRGSSKFNV